ncbi:trypsin-like peptidase domain-containing protein [Streptomyces sp. NPDC004327]|uniref:VMAP-C domain-containing protein n=1 Tax=unclassified Streptomyces TaxID=2593676 RepID=UPI0036B7A4AB
MTQGTGFFVAPGTVVTCAHVAGAEPGALVPVTWDGTTYEGEIRAASPAPPRGRGLWPYPDLAIVRLRRPPAGHPCVRLDPMPVGSGTGLTAAGHSDVYETGVAAERTTPLRAGGCQRLQGGPMIELRDGEINHGLSGGPVLGHHSGGVCAIVKATRRKDSDMGGLGTPVGALRLLDPDAYRELVRAHDLFHAADERWSRLADRLADSGDGSWTAMGPAETRRILGALAALPIRTEPAAHRAAFTAAAPAGSRPRELPPLLDHRDVFTELAELLPPEPGALPYELAFAADRAREAVRDAMRDALREAGPGAVREAAAAQSLRDLVLIAAGALRLGPQAQLRLGAERAPVAAPGPGDDGAEAGGPDAGGAHAGGAEAGGAGSRGPGARGPGVGGAGIGGAETSGADGGERPSVIGRIRHSLRDRTLYHVMVWRYLSARDIVPAGPESEALPLPRAVEHLAALLPEQVEAMGGWGEPGLIELILPKEALDEGFTRLPLPPPFDWACLGHKKGVVVRPLERHEVPSLHGALERRWKELDGRPVGEALVCVCGRDDQHRTALGATFELDPTLAALALAGSPRGGPVADAYRVAVASGVPMMVWHRESPACDRGTAPPCRVPGSGACPGSAFLAAARAGLGASTRDELPESVRRLRLQAQLPQHRGGHVGEDIVLLWDDPRRQIPRVPLAPAEEGSP